jgi:hypothetical protein
MNIYTFFSGIMLIILSASHAIFGIRSIFKDVFLLNIPENMKTSLFIPWHQLTFMLFALGIAQILTAYNRKLRSISSLVLCILLGNLGVFFLLSWIRKDWLVITSSIPQYVLFGILIILTILGMWRHRRS